MNLRMIVAEFLKVLCSVLLSTIHAHNIARWGHGTGCGYGTIQHESRIRHILLSALARTCMSRKTI